jgi:hypothetical protein
MKKRTFRLLFGGADIGEDIGRPVATREESVTACRQILERLHDLPPTTREQADPGVCDDCKHTFDAPRWRFGKVTVCRRCLLRREAGAKALTRPDAPDFGEHSQVVDDVARLAPTPKPENAT